MNPVIVGLLWKATHPTRFVLGVLTVIISTLLVLGLATMGLAALASDDSEKNRINCSGVSWDQPYELRGVNYIERFNKAAKVMSDGKSGPKDAYYFVRSVKDTVKLWRDALTGGLFDDRRANKAVTGFRHADEEARAKALRYCCVQLKKWNDENEVPQPELLSPPAEQQPRVAPPAPNPPADPQPWDPKSASFQAGTRTFNDDTLDRARIVRQVAVDEGLGERAVLVAYMVVFVESGWVSWTEAQSDRDSAGLFQQRRPWGPLADRMDPAKSAEMFFNGGRGGQPGLTDIRDWQTRPMGEVAQAVQVSAFPGKYAGQERSARQLLAAIGGIGGTTRSTPPPAAALKAAKVKRPKFDETVPLASYCAQLDRFDAATGGAADVDDNPTPRNFGGGDIPTRFDQQGNPRTVEEAIAAIRRAAPGGFPGESVAGMCERHMNLAYGIGSGYATANAHWYASGPKWTEGTPPRGALVFWRTSNAAGHVALSLGNGVVASTDYNARTHRFQSGVIGIGPIEDIDRWGPRLGWRVPNFQVGSESGAEA